MLILPAQVQRISHLELSSQFNQSLKLAQHINYTKCNNVKHVKQFVIFVFLSEFYSLVFLVHVVDIFSDSFLDILFNTIPDFLLQYQTAYCLMSHLVNSVQNSIYFLVQFQLLLYWYLYSMCGLQLHSLSTFFYLVSIIIIKVINNKYYIQCIYIVLKIIHTYCKY